MVLQAIVMGVAQHQVRDLIAVQMAMVKCVLPMIPIPGPRDCRWPPLSCADRPCRI